MSKRKSTTTTEIAAIIPATIDPESATMGEFGTETRVKAAFRGAGFVKFRAENDPTWREKLHHTTHDNRDRVAELLVAEMAAQPEDRRSIWNCPTVRELLPVAELQSKYADLNPGQVRMNIGNRLRNAMRKAGR